VCALDAPVSGGTVGAEQGTLAIMAGGRLQDHQRALPCFPPWAAPHVGPHGAGQLAKLANQMIVGITIGAVAEALLLAAKGGADMAKVREAIPADLPTAASCKCTASAWWSATLPRTDV
jgi:2-hydroxy-3-oxopropionate reductase